MERIRQRFIQGFLTLDELDELLQYAMAEYLAKRDVEKNRPEYKWVKITCGSCEGTGEIINECYYCHGVGKIEDRVKV